MELDTLQSAWQNSEPAHKGNKEISEMMRERTHPVLKRIRRQMIIEGIAFTFFLFFYYDLFDGDRKPFYVNALLVAAMLFALVHTITGYKLAKGGVTGSTIKQALSNQLMKLKGYALISIISRVGVAGCLLFFFASIITFTTQKYWLLAAIILLFVIQLVILSGIWLKRIRQIKNAMESFESDALITFK
jgi:cation transport ATPase